MTDQTAEYVALTDEQLRQKEVATKQVVLICMTVLEAIRELGEVPSGHLYAQLCGLLTLDQYTQIIQVLVSSGRITCKNHLLTFVK